MRARFNPQAAPRHGRCRGGAALLCACALLAAPDGAAPAVDPASAAQPGSIAIRNFMFSPMSLVVPAGATVSWTNYDPEPHTIRSVDDTFRSGALDQNETFSHRFDQPGSYRYACSIHPQMVATIVVK